MVTASTYSVLTILYNIFIMHIQKDGICCWFISPNDSFRRISPDVRPQSESGNKMLTVQTRVPSHIDEVLEEGNNR